MSHNITVEPHHLKSCGKIHPWYNLVCWEVLSESSQNPFFFIDFYVTGLQAFLQKNSVLLGPELQRAASLTCILHILIHHERSWYILMVIETVFRDFSRYTIMIDHDVVLLSLNSFDTRGEIVIFHEKWSSLIVIFVHRKVIYHKICFNNYQYLSRHIVIDQYMSGKANAKTDNFFHDVSL